MTLSVEERAGWFRRKIKGREIGFLDWTIDGVPLRVVIAWPNGAIAGEVTPIRNERAEREYRIDYLRALLGGLVGSESAVMPDGRVPLLVCPHDFDLGCRALTTEVVSDGDTVEWRDIAWQAASEPLHLAEQEMPVISLTFDRVQYEKVVRGLLEVDPARSDWAGALAGLIRQRMQDAPEYYEFVTVHDIKAVGPDEIVVIFNQHDSPATRGVRVQRQDIESNELLGSSPLDEVAWYVALLTVEEPLPLSDFDPAPDGVYWLRPQEWLP